MSLIDFEAITKLFSGSDTVSNQKQLFNEVLLMVLARATSADTNVEAVEVQTVKKVLNDVLDEEISEAQIKMAAHSLVFERQSLDRYLAGATRKMSDKERMQILDSLATVIKSDAHIREFELDYFDRVAHALKATPSEISGLRHHCPNW